MPVTTNFKTSPSYETFGDEDKYYKVVFRAGVSVQVRELNELQTILQGQIEKFGDVILKRGTIVKGCNFNFINSYPYAKIKDNDLNGSSVVPSDFVGYFAENSSGLRALIVNSYDGFEASSPNLKTLYMNYINSGNTLTESAFSAGDILTIYDAQYSVQGITVINGGLNFSNNDTVVFSSALVVTVSSGAFTNGEYLVNPTTGANVQIINIDDNTLEGLNQVILKIKPRDADLSNVSSNSTWWSFNINDSVINSSNTVAATIENIIGENAVGRVVTNAVGKINSITVTNSGVGYEIPPTIRVRSANNSSGLSSLNLAAKNYRGMVTVSSDANSIGNGYAFAITEGTTYQKGYFQSVDDQVVIVSKYDQSPNNVVVGFDTIEELIDENVDTRLKDNCQDDDNYTAPGALRLKLTPTLVVLDKDVSDANSEFFSLVEWSDGAPYKQNQTTSFSVIGDEMARRMNEQSGSFVIDRFLVTTSSPSNSSLEGTKFDVVVDPGKAYINGYRVETSRNFKISIDKGLDTETVSNQVVSLNYGNYIRINEVAGLFQFSTGDVVNFYTTAKSFISNSSLVTTGNTTPQGTKIGSARIRSMVLESGNPGEATAVYRLYLFKIQMNAGKNFRNIKSVHYVGTSANGIADIVTELDATTAANVAVLKDIKDDRLVFNAGVSSLKNSNNTYYIYRTLDQTLSISNSGILTKSIAAITDEFYPYSGSLSTSQLKELYVVPLGNMVHDTAITGTVNVQNGNNVIVGTGTSFISNFQVGDYVVLYSNGTTKNSNRITSIVNNTYLTISGNPTFTNTVSTVFRYYPAYVPLPFGTRSGLTANVDSNSNILTLNMGISNGSISGNNAILGVNIQRTNVTSEAKTANRDKYVKIALSNNAGGTTGPWCIGVPDVFRLKGVWVGTSTVNTNSKNVVSEFYVDHNQTQNFYDLSWLYVKSKTSLALSSSSYILVKFDYFTQSDMGYVDAVSYRGTANAEQIALLDSSSLANLTSAAATYEIPQMYTEKGEIIDLIQSFDFRPYVSNTVTPSSTEGSAPLNPNTTFSFGNTADPSNNKKFPLPDSSFITNIEHYIGRKDSVLIGEDGNITVLKGIASSDPRRRLEANQPKDTMKIDILNVPPYPNYPAHPSANVSEIVITRTINEKDIQKRYNDHSIKSIFTQYDLNKNQSEGYTMEEIGNLDRRLKDVERYTVLTLQESEIANRVIPSSIDPSINRFKYGFFADDFSTTSYSELRNPQYSASFKIIGENEYGYYDNENATIIDPQEQTLILKRKTNRILPNRVEWNIDNETGLVSFPYIDEVIIAQNNATEPKVNGNTEGNTSCNNAIVVNTVLLTQSDNFNKHIQNIPVTMGGGSGNVTIYFGTDQGSSFGGLVTGHFHHITVYKNGIDISNSESATSLTSSDKTKLISNGSFANWISGRVGAYEISANSSLILKSGATPYYANGMFNGAGKITFNHNPATGQVYNIAISSRNEHYIKTAIEYPISNCTASNTSSNSANTNIKPNGYSGAMSIESNTYQTISKSRTLRSSNMKKIDFKVVGLKPSTVHTVRFDNKEIPYFYSGTPNTDIYTTRKINSSTFDVVNMNNVIVPNNDLFATDIHGIIEFSIHFPDKYWSSVSKSLFAATANVRYYSVSVSGLNSSASVKILLPTRDFINGYNW